MTNICPLYVKYVDRIQNLKLISYKITNDKMSNIRMKHTNRKLHGF